MKKVPLQLKDGRGGLNNSNPPATLPANQFAKLSNYLVDDGAYLALRRGQDLIQYAPIDPTLFTPDANTLSLFHFDGNFTDAGTTGTSLSQLTTAPTYPKSIFTTGIKMAQISSGGPYGSGIYGSTTSHFHGKTALTVEGWVEINPDNTGRPIATITKGNTVRNLSNDGAPLFASYKDVVVTEPGFTLRETIFYNGIRFRRDWDSVNQKHASGVYAEFQLHTGIAGEVTTLIRTGELPTNREIHIRGTYDGATGKMAFIVNGSEVAATFAQTAGAIYNSGLSLVFIGSHIALADGLSFPVVTNYWNVFNGVIDEVRISDVVREGVPFKKPRGSGMVLSKADGTNHLIVAADEGLYYTTGNSEWTLLLNVDPATGSPLSSTARWSGAQINDRLYMSNGTNTPMVWDGTRLVPAGNPITPLTLTNHATEAGMAAGTYKYCYTYAYGDYETGPSPEATISSNGNVVEIQGMPYRHDNCDFIKVYRTKAGNDEFYLLREIANQPLLAGLTTAGIFTNKASMQGPWIDLEDPASDTGGDGVPDGTLDGALHDDLDYAQMTSEVLTSVFPKAEYLLSEHNRLFMNDPDAPYSVRWSELSAPDCVLALSFVDVKADRGRVVGFASYYGEIHISKNGRATAVLRGTDPSNWTLTENLHPDVGARDHWSFVRRYPVNNETKYRLCFFGPDGIYSYAGNSIEKISDDISATFESLSVNSSTRENWVTSEFFDFSDVSTANGGSADANIITTDYETDGLREEAGKIKIVDQLDYIGLWRNGDSPEGESSRILAVCKGNAEGEFIYSTYASSKLWRTLDNFKTAAELCDVSKLLGADTNHRIIEICKRGDDQVYYLFTDTETAGVSMGGYIYSYDATPGVEGTGVVYANADGTGKLYYEADVPWQFFGDGPYNKTASTFTDYVYGGITDPNAQPTKSFYTIGKETWMPAPYANPYLNHSQKVLFSPNAAGTAINIYSALSLNGVASTLVQGEFVNGYSNLLSANYYSFRDAGQTVVRSVGPGGTIYGFRWLTTNNFRLTFTNRETAMWLGGTVRPQAFWNATVSRMFFTAYNAEDANGNRTGNVYSSTGVQGTGNLVSVSASLTSFIALTASSTEAFFTDQAADTTGGLGFYTRLNKFTLATPGTNGSGVTTFSAFSQVNHLPLRLGRNANAVTGAKIATIGKSWNVNTKDNYTYKGFFGRLNQGTGVHTEGVYLVENANAGPFPVEIAVQTGTPYSCYVAIQNITTAALYEIDADFQASSVSIYKADGYEGYLATAAATGIRSNLIFVASSASAGSYKWADRLYFYTKAATATDQRMVQIGVPGSWTVRGEYVSKFNNLGAIGALGDFGTDYSGSIQFFIRNAADALSLAASEKSITPNYKIAGFYPIASFVQWRVLLTWDYTVDIPTESPEIDFVDIEYFIGESTVPNVATGHFDGRTYFACAEKGETENNLVLVLDKNEKWTIYEGWSIKGFNSFRELFTAFQNYEFVRCESGDTDLGKRIEGLARTGVISDDAEKSIEDLRADVLTWTNKDNPSQNGYVVVRPYGGDDAVTPDWAIAMPAHTKEESRRVFGAPVGAFDWGWAKAFSLEIKTSDQTTGNYRPAVGQREVIQSLDLTLSVAPTGRESSVK